MMTMQPRMKRRRLLGHRKMLGVRVGRPALRIASDGGGLAGLES